MVTLEASNILLNLTASTKEEVICALADCLVRNGYVGPTYAAAVLAREALYPTGLPTEDVPTALPHAFSDDIFKTGVSVARLTGPVSFGNMADKAELLPVQLVFLLANTSGESAHLEDLQALMGCFCREGFLSALMAAPDAQAFADVFAHSDSYQEA